MTEKKKQVLALALGIGFMPPLWAVLAPYIGISTGAVALICAGVYVTNGNNLKDAPKILLGFWCGDLWAVLALSIMSKLNWNENMELFLTLCILGILAVVLSSMLNKVIFLPAWLTGWAIGLTIMTPGSMGHIAVEIAAAMAVGVFYVGAGVDLFTKIITGKRKKGSGNSAVELR